VETLEIKRLLEIHDFVIFSKELFALFPGRSKITLAEMPTELQKHYFKLYRTYQEENHGCYIRELANRKPIK